jgi:hypothetical protein
MPQVSTFLETPHIESAAHSEAESSSGVIRIATFALVVVQFSIASRAEDSFFSLVNHVRRKTLLEVSVFVTSAWHVGKLSCEFRHESTSGEVEESGQDNKLKLHS